MNARTGVVAGVSVVAVLATAGVIAVRLSRDADDVLTTRRAVVRTPTPVASSTVSPSRTPASPTPVRTTPTPSVDPTKRLLAEQQRIVAQNPLYRVGRLPASRCKEPSVRPTTVANVRKYYAQSIACLDKTWKPVVEKAGFTFQSPRLEVISGGVRTSCDVQDSAAYCGDGVISMNAKYDIDNYRNQDKLWARTTMAHLIAHEYAHHIQRLAGISTASWTRRPYLTGTDATLLESRRLELQASCLSGAYLGADRKYFPVSGAWRSRWLWTIRNRGDEWNPQRDHGSAKSHGRWTKRGFDAASASACNTFTASAGTVS